MVECGALKKLPMRDYVAAISVGIVGGELLVDLCYEEDSRADVDMNVVMTGGGALRRSAGHRRADALRRRARWSACSS